ncbi:MAG: glycogen debranching N-terminal domain-containing protein, partial [Nostoc sp.]
ALFEEIEVSNYSTTTVNFELSISFDADFVDLFEVRGYDREKRGRLLRLVELTAEEETFSLIDGVASVPKEASASREQSLTLAYQGLDGSVMESRILFQHRQPDSFKGYTAVWQLELA